MPWMPVTGPSGKAAAICALQFPNVFHQVIRRLITSMTVSIIAQASGPPPKVLPRSPLPMSRRDVLAEQQRAAGETAAQGLGQRSADPVPGRRGRLQRAGRFGRPRSALRRRSVMRPAASQARASVSRKTGSRSTAPATPCTSSTITAAVSPPISRAAAALSLSRNEVDVERRARKAIPAAGRAPGHRTGSSGTAVEAVLDCRDARCCRSA